MLIMFHYFHFCPVFKNLISHCMFLFVRDKVKVVLDKSCKIARLSVCHRIKPFSLTYTGSPIIMLDFDSIKALSVVCCPDWMGLASWPCIHVVSEIFWLVLLCFRGSSWQPLLKKLPNDQKLWESSVGLCGCIATAVCMLWNCSQKWWMDTKLTRMLRCNVTHLFFRILVYISSLG